MSSMPQTGHSHSSPFPQMMALNASGGTIPESSPNKMTPSAMCKHGQELVQDITQKMLDILGILKTMPVQNFASASSLLDSTSLLMS